MPTLLAVWILAVCYTFIQESIAIHINRGLVWLIMQVQGDQGPTQESLYRIFVETADGGVPAGSFVGFLVAIVAVCLMGALLASVVGRWLWCLVETFIMSIPILNKIYPYVKQVTDFVLTREGQQAFFSRVVAVEYPRRGTWSLGFVTGTPLIEVAAQSDQEMLTVMIPNSPTPLTGYVVMVARSETIPLDISIEEAFRFAISAGVITPNQPLLKPPSLAVDHKDESQ